MATYRNQRLRSATGVVSIAESHARFAFSYQIVESFLFQLIKEFLTGLYSIFPTLLVITAKPSHQFLRSFAAIIGCVTIEQRTCGKQADTYFQAHGRCTGQASAPVVGFFFVDVPRKFFAADGFIQQFDDEIHRFLQSATSRHPQTIFCGNSTIYNRQTAEVAKHFGILGSYHYFSLSFQAQLLGFIHIGHAIHILYKYPSHTDALPAIASCKSIFGTSGTIGCFLRTGIVSTTVIGFIRTVPIQSGITQICQAFQYAIPHTGGVVITVVRPKRVWQITIAVPQYTARIYRRRKNGVNGNIRTGRFLKEFLTQCKVLA